MNKRKSFMVFLILAVLLACDSTNQKTDCDELMAEELNMAKLVMGGLDSVLIHCGGVDSVELELIKMTSFMVALDTGKKNLTTLVDKLINFREDKRYEGLKMAVILRKKTYEEDQWSQDSIQMRELLQFPNEDMSLFDSLVKRQENVGVQYSEIMKQVNQLMIQRQVDKIGRTMLDSSEDKN